MIDIDKSEIEKIHESLSKLKDAGLINYHVNKIDSNIGDDILSIQITPACYKFAETLEQIKAQFSTIH